MAEEQTQHQRDITRRATSLLLTAVIAVAVIGFVVGIDYGAPYPDRPVTPEQDTGVDERPADVLPAMSYAEIRRTPTGPTDRWRQSINQLPQSQSQSSHLAEASANVSPQARRASLQTRSQRRAYNGAPPVIPHMVKQISTNACLACHGEGFRLENRTARQQPHPHMTNCTQCHVPPSPNELPGTLAVQNNFDGVAAPFEGERAWPGAPPTVPHSTQMRDNCLACHGPNGWPGMQTTHPERHNCLQCHAPSAELDRNITADKHSFIPPPAVRHTENTQRNTTNP